MSWRVLVFRAHFADVRPAPGEVPGQRAEQDGEPDAADKTTESAAAVRREVPGRRR